MKISEATAEQKTRALAELDGWKRNKQLDFIRISCGEQSTVHCWSRGREVIHNLPNYLTSYDAILPLIQRQGDLFMEHFMEIIKQMYAGKYVLQLTTEQLSNALLVATGKFEL